MPLALDIARAHLLGRRRQSLVAILGVTLGVAFFIAMSAMMHGFQNYFRTQIVDSNPHIMITDEIRRPARQPLALLHPDAAVAVTRVLPRDPVRGIANAGAILDALGRMRGLAAAPTLRGQLILRRAGRDYAVAALGIDPVREARVTQLADNLVAGTLDALARQSNGVIIGRALALKMGAGLGDTITGVATTGASAALRIVGLFSTGIETQDLGQVYLQLAREQALEDRPLVVNEIDIRLEDITRSVAMAKEIEGQFGFKAAPWEETYSRILAVFLLQNIIMTTVTGAILVVAGFGIFNVISTVVLEKARDIAIMRSIGLSRRVIVRIFVVEGALVGSIGTMLGWLVAMAMAAGIARIPAPGATDPNETMRVAQSLDLYVVASLIAMAAAVGAAWLPARRAAQTDPLAVIRGAT